MTVNEHVATRTQHEIWNGPVGAAWVRHAEIHDQQAAPFGEATMDAVGPVDDARVLDVGCGTGATVTQLLSRGAGAVLGIDMSVPMIDLNSVARFFSASPGGSAATASKISRSAQAL